MEQYQEINRRLYSHDQTMKSIQINIWKLMEGVKFMVSKTNKEESSSLVDCLYSEEEDTLDLKSVEVEEGTFVSPPPPNLVYRLENQTHDKVVDHQPMPIIAPASALANASSNHQMMDQTEVLQSPDSLKTKVTEPVHRNFEAIKQFMRSSGKNPIVV
ncbi:hypothetical protein L1987_53421 [Smallanthus sonchifolius]|uniref:Uncharacterized protein n=1 Tax=Smallanthus sonchifolius TaxID=185202 RepID=A0ACB9EW82_9ASTR|nr:hypothetical protein L1987_53421 [Smallanthus sonchifolius]